MLLNWLNNPGMMFILMPKNMAKQMNLWMLADSKINKIEKMLE